MTFLGKSLLLPSTALSLVLLLQLYIKENPAVLVLSFAVTYTWSLCWFQSLYERMGVFQSLRYSHRRNQQQGSQPKFIFHCWRASQSHWSLQGWSPHCAGNRPGAASLLAPADRARYMCKWYLFSPRIWTSQMSSQRATCDAERKRSEVLNSRGFAKWILREDLIQAHGELHACIDYCAATDLSKIWPLSGNSAKNSSSQRWLLLFVSLRTASALLKITFALIVLEEINYLFLKRRNMFGHVQWKLKFYHLLQWSEAAFRHQWHMTSKYTVNMLIRLSALVRYSEAEERLQAYLFLFYFTVKLQNPNIL